MKSIFVGFLFIFGFAYATNLGNFGGSSSGLTPTVASVQFGINQVLPVSPVVYGTQNFPVLVDITPAQIAQLQNDAEAWFAARFGIYYPTGPTPKVNATSGFSLVAISVGDPYAVYTIYDSLNIFGPTDPNRAKGLIKVRLLEFVASPPANISSNFTNYGGTYAASSPFDTVIEPGDNIAYGFYNFTQECDSHSGCNRAVAVLVNFRAFVPTRSSLLLPDVDISVEQFQLCSQTWGSGLSVLQVLYPITSFPAQVWFFNNFHFPGPSSFLSVPPWTTCSQY